MKKVYFLSGLGADSRVFSLMDLSFCEPVFIDWLEPKKEETLKEYALRMMPADNESFTIVGVSFGGMLASEMCRANPKIKAILISSNKSSSEFPKYLRVGKYFPIYRIVPFGLVKKVYPVYNSIFGTGEKEINRVVLELSKLADPTFIYWAVHAILSWKSDNSPSNIIQIHGSSDILLPLKFVKPDYIIKGGKHKMVLDKHKEISDLLKKLIG